MPQRLKILISAYACEPGKGSEPEVGWQWALQMARYHDVTVLTRANNRAVIEAALPALPEPRPQFVYHDLPRTLLRLKDRFHATRAYYVAWQRSARKVIAALLREQHFDLLHHFTFAAFRYPTAVSGHGAPCVWGPVGGIESIPAPLLPWRHPRPLLAELLRNIDNRLQSGSLSGLAWRARAASLVLASTRQMQETFAGFDVTSKLVPAIGLHTSEFPIPNRQAHSGPLRLLYVGNLLLWKGVDLGLEALKTSGSGAQLTIIGDGPFRRPLKALAARLGLADRVEFRGRLPRPEVLASYAHHDAFLFPSLHDSGGYAVIEAMCNAMPVICLATGGPEIAVQPGCGIRVPLGSRAEVVTGLSEAIRLYHADRRRLVSDGVSARASVETHYDWAHKGVQMAGCYHELLDPTLAQSPPSR